MPATPQLIVGNTVGEHAFFASLLRQPTLTLVGFPLAHASHYGPMPHFERAVAVHVSDPLRPTGTVVRYVDRRAEDAWAVAQGRRALRRLAWQYRWRYLTILFAHVQSLRDDWRIVRRRRKAR